MTYLPGNAVMVRGNLHVRIECQGTLAGHLRFALADVLLVEQELPIEIAHVDRVQVDLKGKSRIKSRL